MRRRRHLRNRQPVTDDGQHGGSCRGSDTDGVHRGGLFFEREIGGVMDRGRTKVLIIGGGFGGLFCARRLGRVDVEVTLLDRAACHVFQPLLYQCATGTLSIGQISRSLREELARHRNVTTLLGEAFDLDADARRVTARRPDDTTFTLDYDVLVVAVGMRQSYFGQRGIRAVGAGDEDPRRRIEHPPQAVRRVRDGRNAASRTRARRVADLRHSRWRTHRCRVGRADPRNGYSSPGQGVPQHRTRRRAGTALRRRQLRSRQFRARPYRTKPPRSCRIWASNCTWVCMSPTFVTTA